MKIRCSFNDLVKIEDLKPFPDNPNKHSKEQIDLLAKIMVYQGVRHPIVVSSRSGFITSGHGRMAAAIVNEWKEFPVDYQDYETHEMELADLVADNKIAELSQMDDEIVQAFSLELGPDFDFDLLGSPHFKVSGVDTLPPEHPEPKNVRKIKCPKCGEKFDA